MNDNDVTIDGDVTRASPATPGNPVTRFEPGVIVAGRYRLVALLGKGGMGEVYRADDLTLDHPVALKFLPAGVAADAARLASFHNELRIARQVSHRNVCRLYDLGEAGGRRFLTMEYVDGEDLASLLRRVGRVPEERGLQMARQLCAGVAAAHERGVIHRDLKPANVMIDGAGDVRITDFGIATVGGQQDETFVGTPQYMAPEQLAGQPASAASDIYALGLILFELFTGRRVVDGRTIDDLRAFHSGGTITTPSSIVKDLDPALERVILRCLDRVPAKRPASALAVAAGLPGADPVAAALAAGETPSPELLIAAGEADALPVARGLMLAGAALMGLLLFALASPRLSIPGRVPLDTAPAVLVDRAEQFLTSIGYTRAVGDQAFDFVGDGDYLTWLIATRPTPQRWDVVSSGNPSAVLFWYRTSPRVLEPKDGVAVTADDPPLDASGERLVMLDGRGRLRKFVSVPAPRLANQDAAAARTPPWEKAFAAASLDLAAFTPVASQWTPQDYADTLAAWEGVLPDSNDIHVRVEATAFRGAITSFTVIGPWTRPALLQPRTASTIDRVFVAVALTVFCGAYLAAAILARRNLRSGRADRRGAARLIGTMVAIGLLAWLFDAHHTFDVESESASLFRGAGEVLFVVALVWPMYFAVEPYVRRFWPDSLLGWSRLVSGHVRDPRVGRDVLAGAVYGVLASLLVLGRASIVPWLGYAAPRPAFGNEVHLLHGPGAIVAGILLSLLGAMQAALEAVLLVVLVRLLVRKTWLSAAVSAVLLSVFFVNGAGTTNTLLPLAFLASGGVLLTTVVFRSGLLALMVALFVYIVTIYGPMMPNPAHWTAVPGNLTFLTVAGLTMFGFYASRAGQPLFGRISEP